MVDHNAMALTQRREQAMADLRVDSEGFLLSRDDWNEDVMRELALRDGMTLNEDHVRCILKARDMYDEDGTVPPIRLFAKAVGIQDRKAKELYDLFETGPMKRICKWGGLPKPTGCV
jgi:tRNA 2-thiouridine synthesizing protein E